MSASASLSRSDTSWRANQTIGVVANTSVTDDRAVLLTERISRTPGMPFIAVSIGIRQVLLDLGGRQPRRGRQDGPACW